MAHDESSPPPPNDAIPTPEAPPFPAAWQPITPGGVAAFSRARMGRLFFFQSFIAVLTAGVVVWFLATAWFPTVLQAIRQLPDTGTIAGGQLTAPRDSVLPLAESRYLAFFEDTNNTTRAGVAADLRIGFHRDHVAICSLFGCLTLRYPAGPPVPFNRNELEPWWRAWEPMLLALVSLAVVALLVASWLALATLAWPVVWVFAYLNDRQLTCVGSWKLASATLLPGALLAALALVLYGLDVVNLLGFLLLWVTHFVVGWIYLFAAPLALPGVVSAVPVAKDPFTNSPDEPKPRPSNPFAAP